MSFLLWSTTELHVHKLCRERRKTYCVF